MPDPTPEALDRELEAITAIVRVLGPLDREARARVLEAVEALAPWRRAPTQRRSAGLDTHRSES